MLSSSPAQRHGLHEVAASAAAALGVTELDDTLGLGKQQRVVIVLLDGLGAQQLDAHADLAPFLTAQRTTTLQTAFPTSTSPALGSFGTGLLPGAHGLVASLFVLPETGEILNPLHWPTDATGAASPYAVQPEPTVFERAARAGVAVTSIGSAKYAQSGLTRAVLRGADYAVADEIAMKLSRLQMALVAAPSLAYVYWRDIDRAGHAHGVDSKQWRAAVRQADALCEMLAAALPPDTLMLVTADHGMVDCPPASRVHVESDPLLSAGVRLVAGEPRVRQLYTQPDARGVVAGDVAARDVAARWKDRLGDRATVLLREELSLRGLLDPVDDEIAARIGDVVVIAHGDLGIASDVDHRTSALIGQHGALSDAEQLVPLIVVER